ncbi:37S ribosomal protein S9, mitochondrial [Diatrype stigma]|uniref:Small ribosomal subunit protein uS9m n=1 Tax=Diatrype stigma TaxID=117547 RepID=A0AAN9URS2_9PEZI
MASLRYGFRCLRDIRTTAKIQYQVPAAVAVTTPRRTTTTTTTTNAQRRTLSTTPSRRQQLEAGSGGAGGDAAFQAMLSAATVRDAQERSGPEFSGYHPEEVVTDHVRPMPVSPSYFSKNTTFNDSFVLIQDLARKYARLPPAPPGLVERVAWKNKEHYRMAVGEQVKGKDFLTCLKLAKRLNKIHPELMPDEVKEGIQPFKRDINIYLNTPKPIPIDKFGRSHGVGRRKESTARAYLVEGTGEVLINGKPLTEAFGRVHDRESAVWALKTTNRIDKYNVWARVSGGGTTGQAEALAMAIAKAIVVHEPALKTHLRKAGCITRDPRAVERKKAGRVKARKSPQWIKR